MLRSVDHRPLAPGWTSPEKEDDMLLLPIDGFDDSVGEGLPAETLVRARLPCSDGERSIEE